MNFYFFKYTIGLSIQPPAPSPPFSSSFNDQEQELIHSKRDHDKLEKELLKRKVEFGMNVGLSIGLTTTTTTGGDNDQSSLLFEEDEEEEEERIERKYQEITSQKSNNYDTSSSLYETTTKVQFDPNLVPIDQLIPPPQSPNNYYFDDTRGRDEDENGGLRDDEIELEEDEEVDPLNLEQTQLQPYSHPSQQKEEREEDDEEEVEEEEEKNEFIMDEMWENPIIQSLFEGIVENPGEISGITGL